MEILGITGTFGAGKGTVVEYLQAKGFVHFSSSGFITEEVVRRGMPVNRDSMTVAANDLRAQHSPSYIVEQLYDRAVAQGQNAIIESIRTVGEAEALRTSAARDGARAWLIAVDADIKVRYGRIQVRASEKDHVSFETFEEKERGEMNSADPTKQNISGVMALADFTIQNNGTLKELQEQVDEILKSIGCCTF
jgi:dephospho-CoA kinase